MVIGYRLYNNTDALLPLIQLVRNSEEAISRLSERRLQTYAAQSLLLRLIESFWPAPSTAQIDKSESGAPQLSINGENVYCSITHKKGCIAVAYSTRDPIGIDLENLQSGKNYQRIKRHYQHGFLNSAQPTHKAFLEHWTLAEAMSKATGKPLLSLLEKPVTEEMDRANFYSLDSFMLCAYQTGQTEESHSIYQLTQDNQWQ